MTSQRRNHARNREIRAYINNCLAQNGWGGVSLDDLLDYISNRRRFSDLMVYPSSERAVQLRSLSATLQSHRQTTSALIRQYKGKDAKSLRRVYGFDPIKKVWFHITAQIIYHKEEELRLHIKNAIDHNLKPHKTGTNETIKWFNSVLDLAEQGLQFAEPEVSQPVLLMA